MIFGIFDFLVSIHWKCTISTSLAASQIGFLESRFILTTTLLPCDREVSSSAILVIAVNGVMRPRRSPY